MATVAPPSEADQYGRFVETTMRQLKAGLELDHTDKKQRIANVLDTDVLTNDPTKSAAQRVLEGRYALGADDAAYLQTGLATLWSTAPGSKDASGDDLALAPPGLYTPDAVDGIRAGLLRALKSKNRALGKQSPAQLDAFAPALRLLFSIPTLRTDVLAALNATRPAASQLGNTNIDTVLTFEWAAKRAALQTAEQADQTSGTTTAVPLRLQFNANLEVMRELLARLHDHLSDASKRSGAGGTTSTLTQMILKAVEDQARALEAATKALEAAKARNRQLVRQLAALGMRLDRERNEHQAAKDKIVKLMVQKVDLKTQLRDCIRAKALLEQQLADEKKESAKRANSTRSFCCWWGGDCRCSHCLECWCHGVCHSKFV